MNTVAGGEVGERGKFMIQSGLSLGYLVREAAWCMMSQCFFTKIAGRTHR